MEDRVSASKKDLLCLEMLEDSGGDDSDYEGFDEDHGEDLDDYYGVYSEEEALDVLLARLEDGDWPARRVALYTLGNLEPAALARSTSTAWSLGSRTPIGTCAGRHW